MCIKSDDGTPKASFFYVAYTKDDVPDISKRPMSFVYNGGPGSASLFTHMGLGPKRIVLTDDGHGMPAPYSIVDNESSFLDATDMVFVDAISTGYSRPVPGENAAQFYGTVQDATWFSDFIYQYLTRNERWASPKFLIGESYGTTRSAQMSSILQQRHQIYLNGIVLVSSVAFANWGADDRLKFFLPTIPCPRGITTCFRRICRRRTSNPSRRRRASSPTANTRRRWRRATSCLRRSIKKWFRIWRASPAFRRSTSKKPICASAPQRWFKELLRDKRLTVGRLDARFTGMDVDAAGERNEYDSSEASYEGAYSAMFQDYVRRELKWNTDMFYTITANVRPWDQGQPGQVAESLRSAMTQQSTLQGAGGVRLLRPRHSVQRHRADRVAHESGAAHPQERQLRVLRGRPHDVHRQEGARQAPQGCRRFHHRQELIKKEFGAR